MQESMPPGGGLTVGVPKETTAGERRIALIPDTVKRLTGQGLAVLIQRSAGDAANFPDEAYADAGGTVVDDAAAVYDGADIICKVQRPSDNEVGRLRDGQILISFLAALNYPEGIQDLANRGVTALGMEAIPRTTRAQAMDALSSQSNIAGYKAVILASDHLGKLFPMLMTAAGTIAPSKVLVIGAGVAGLQAIATARRLGAVVEAYDTRPVVKEQVESLGARFVDVEAPEADTQDAGGYAREASAELLRRQQEVLAERSVRSDVIITTALVPGRPAPRLISAETVAAMQPGSVIIDLAAENGGNCELTRKDETVVEHGVIIIGPTNLPSEIPTHSSQMYARNVQSLLGLLVNDGQISLDFGDDIIDATCLTHGGDIRYAPVRERLGLPPLVITEKEIEPEPEPEAVPEPSDRGVEPEAPIDAAMPAGVPVASSVSDEPSEPSDVPPRSAEAASIPEDVQFDETEEGPTEVILTTPPEPVTEGEPDEASGEDTLSDEEERRRP